MVDKKLVEPMLMILRLFYIIIFVMNITIEHILAVLFSTVLFALTSADMILKKLQN